MQKYYVYVLKSDAYNRIYIGQTENLSKRMERHNQGWVKSTKPYRPWKLLFFEEVDSREHALKRERFWKQSNNRMKIRSMKFF